MDLLFKLEDVIKKYDGVPVLKVNNLEIAKNRIYAVIGPNGSGKSTLLKLLNLLEESNQGRIIYQGVDTGSAVESVRMKIRRQMCMVFQYNYLFNASVYDNVAYGLKLRGINGSELQRRVKDALSFVGLSDFDSRNAHKLSGGETQRVALARAVVIQPEVLLLDEPTANLDPDSVALIERLVRRIHETTHTTIMIVTHNLFQAKRLADEAIFLYEGNLIEKSPVAQVFTNPQSELTQKFISGTMVY